MLFSKKKNGISLLLKQQPYTRSAKASSFGSCSCSEKRGKHRFNKGKKYLTPNCQEAQRLSRWHRVKKRDGDSRSLTGEMGMGDGEEAAALLKEISFFSSCEWCKGENYNAGLCHQTCSPTFSAEASASSASQAMTLSACQTAPVK